MKYKQSKTIVFTFFIVLALILTSVGSLGISTDLDNKITKTSSTKKSSIVCTKTLSKYMLSPSILSKNSNLYVVDEPDLDNSGNIVVADALGDESHPSLVVDNLDALVAYEYKNGDNTTVYIKTSSDYGQNWPETPFHWDLSVNVSSPAFTDLCVTGKQAFGVFISPDNSSYIFEITIPKISKINTWSNLLWDYSHIEDETTEEYIGKFWNFTTPDVVCFPDIDIPWIIATIGDSEFIEGYEGYDCKNSPIFLYKNSDNPEGSRSIAFFPEVKNCSNISICHGVSDTSKPMIYGVCEIKNGTNKNLLFFEGNPDIWETQDLLIKQVIPSSENLLHPKIAVKNTEVFIVAETDTNNSDLVLFYSSDRGDTWEEPQFIANNSLPLSDFSYSSERLHIKFIDKSIDMDGYIKKWKWDFGDGNISTDQNPEYTYASPGTYTINLTIWDDDDANDTISKEITISNTTPIANFIYIPGKPGINENITFSSISTTYSDREIVNHTWYFGDDTGPFYTGNETNITHEYSTNGSYVVNLTVIDNKSEIGYIEKTIYVGLVADFTFNDTIYSIGESINFTDISSVPINHTITNYTWDFGDGTNSALQNPKHNYTKPGYYKVELTIEDNYSNTDSVSKIVKVRPDEFIPRYPDIYIDNKKIYVTYTIGQNLIIIGSSDNGKNWTTGKMLNDEIYCVIEGYRNTDMVDMNRVIWTDTRNANEDIYYSLSYTPKADLRITNFTLTNEIPIPKTNNVISITIGNQGDGYAENIQLQIKYKCEDENETILKTEYIPHLSSGDTRTVLFSLFAFKNPDYFQAFKTFAGIQNITVIIDSNHRYESGESFDDNVLTKAITYKDIFPVIGKFKILEDFFKSLKNSEK